MEFIEEIREFDARPEGVRELLWDYCGRSDVESVRCLHAVEEECRYEVEFSNCVTPRLSATEVEYLFGKVVVEIFSDPAIE